jgi:hypothetical protein
MSTPSPRTEYVRESGRRPARPGTTGAVSRRLSLPIASRVGTYAAPPAEPRRRAERSPRPRAQRGAVPQRSRGQRNRAVLGSRAELWPRTPDGRLTAINDPLDVNSLLNELEDKTREPSDLCAIAMRDKEPDSVWATPAPGCTSRAAPTRPRRTALRGCSRPGPWRPSSQRPATPWQQAAAREASRCQAQFARKAARGPWEWKEVPSAKSEPTLPTRRGARATSARGCATSCSRPQPDERSTAAAWKRRRWDDHRSCRPPISSRSLPSAAAAAPTTSPVATAGRRFDS